MMKHSIKIKKIRTEISHASRFWTTEHQILSYLITTVKIMQLQLLPVRLSDSIVCLGIYFLKTELKSDCTVLPILILGIKFFLHQVPIQENKKI